jgi:hypothetical protein
MRPILEKWSNVGLSESAGLCSSSVVHETAAELFLFLVYGIRKYTTNSTLQVHVDAKGTHIVSAILHVDEEYHSEADERWPLQIQDHQGTSC